MTAVHRPLRFMAALLVACVAGACSAPPCGLDSPDPAERLRAAVEAADRGDDRAIPELIRLLDSDDAAARLVAAYELERLTGQTLGYDYAGPEWDRAAAADRWASWYEARAGRGTEAPEVGR